MEPSPTYKLDRQGYISHQIGDSSDYLCGISVTYKDRWIYRIYWTSNHKHALSVFDLCKVWEKIATSTAMEYENAPVETLVGTTSSYITHELPYKLSAGRETLYLNTYNISIQRWSLEQLTPKWLHAATKPTPPVLKIQNIYDYAFLVGTLCSMCTKPPNWKLSVPKIVKDLYWRAGLIDDLDGYFRQGKVFKPGTQLTEATPNNMREEYRDLEPKKPSPILKPQSLYGYAFKVGTLCSMGTEPPNWEPLIPVLAARANACVPTSEGGMKAVIQVMDVCFRVGTLCKPGTLLSDYTGLPVDCQSDRYAAQMQ